MREREQELTHAFFRCQGNEGTKTRKRNTCEFNNALEAISQVKERTERKKKLKKITKRKRGNKK